MGGGSSVPLEQRMTADAPVELPPVQADGSAGHRDETMVGGSPTYYRRGYSSASGIMQMYSQSEGDKADAMEEFKQRRAALEIQASSNWHRILEHAKDQMDQGKFEKPRCPECNRGKHEGSRCRLCGADVSDAARSTSSASPEGSPGGFKYSPVSPHLQWNPETKTYDRVDVQRQEEEEERDDYRADLKTGSPGSPSQSHSVVGDKDHDFIEMNKLIGIMRGNGDKEVEMRRKRLGTAGVSSLTIVGAKAMQEELDSRAKEQQHALSAAKISDKVRRIQARKLKAERENLLLTLRGIINNSIDFEKKKRHRLRREERKKNPGSPPAPRSDSDSDSIGDSDSLSDDEEFDDEDFAFDEPPPPDFESPPVCIELRSRSSDSLTVQWDASADGARFVERLHAAYGGNKIPLYECAYKIHNDGTDAWRKAGKKGSKRQLTIEGLVPNTPYVVRARRVGWGDWGESVVIRTGPGLPSPPKALAAKEVTSSSVLVTWQAPDKDNGLPVVEYSVSCKAYGGSFVEVYAGRDRVLLHTQLPPNVVHIFEVRARNRLGLGESSQRLAVRTLPQGAADMTPWAEAVDDRSGKLFYRHPRSNETSWVMPKGALLDEAASLRNKRAFLSKRIVSRAQDACLEMGVHAYVISLQVRRENILEESLQRVYALSKNEVDAGPIRVKFEGEDGLDAGGLAKDWFNQVSRSLAEGSTGLLQVGADGEANIDTRAGVIHQPSESRWLFKALGIFVAKAIIDCQSLGIMFNPMLLLHMSGKTPSLADLASIDGSFYKGLKWVEENDVTGADLTFSATYELFGENQVFDLLEGGRDAEVTQGNKAEYVDLMVQWLTKQRYEPCLSHFLEGFHRHVPKRDLQHFRGDELRVMIAGQVTIDAKDVMRETTFSGGFDSGSDQVQWLRDLLDRSDQQSLSRFLRFVTGCQCMPVEGLAPPLMITHTDGSDDTLPRAHTCFNQLVLPKYSTSEVLEAKLLFALENSQDGFFLS